MFGKYPMALKKARTGEKGESSKGSGSWDKKIFVSAEAAERYQFLA